MTRTGTHIGVLAAAREHGIPLGTLKSRLRRMTLPEAVALGRRSMREAHPKGASRAAAEAHGIPIMTLRHRMDRGLSAREAAAVPNGAGNVADTTGLGERLRAAVPAAVRRAVDREIRAAVRAAETPSAAVLAALRIRPMRVRDLARWVCADFPEADRFRTIANIVSGLRTRGLVYASGLRGPRNAAIWKAT